MKITKLVHACLLVEKDAKKALIDPGNYSWDSGIIDQALLKDIDYVLVTHAHPDHINKTFANVVNELSPNALWFVTQATRELLENIIPEENIKLESMLSDVKFIESEHADLTHWGSCRDHTSFVLFEELFISGDCHTNTSMHGARVLAGAINGGPWGAVKGELDMIAALDKKPEKFIPVHDWHWNDIARKNFYHGLVDAMQKLGVEFVPVENGVQIEV